MLTTRQKIALARTVQAPVVAARGLATLGPATTVRRRGVTWTLDLREGIDFSIWLLGAFELANEDDPVLAKTKIQVQAPKMPDDEDE